METGTAATGTSAAQRGNGRAPSETFEVRNPATGDLIREIGIDAPERVREIVARVRSNQPEWEAIGHRERYTGWGSCATG